MQCIMTNPSSASEERCEYPPYIQNQLDKREVLCKFHAMEKVVKHAHEKKSTPADAAADLFS
jgi:hypothetical protein